MEMHCVILALYLLFLKQSEGVKCMQPSDARYLTTAAEIPEEWLNTGWHTGKYLSTDHNTLENEASEDSSHRRGVIFTTIGTRIWWLEETSKHVHFIFTEDQTKILCAHTVGGLRIDWFDNSEANRGEDWCQWDIHNNSNDATMFQMKNHVFAESMPEVGYVYFDKTGIYFDYNENSHNDGRNVIKDARKWWVWEKANSSQRDFSSIEEQCTIGPSGKPVFLETSEDLISARSAGGRNKINPFVSSNKFATCSPGWYLYESKCYRIFRNILLTQSKAIRVCNFLGGSLVVPKKQKEQAFLVRLLRRFDRNSQFWLGMMARDTGRRFFDVEGNPLIFRRWGKKRSSFADDKCSFWSRRRWYTANCNAQHKLMCSKEASIKNSFLCGRIQEKAVDTLMRRAAGETEYQGKIVNGMPAEEGQFPWQVSLRFKIPVHYGGAEVVHNCGGTLIDECWVLTAAHCFIERDASLFYVRIGDLNNEVDDGTEQDFDIESLFIHEEYAVVPSPRNDIALLKLSRKGGKCARFNHAIQPACLPDETFNIKESGEKCQVSGWGVTNETMGQQSSASNLAWVTLPTLRNSYCKSRYNKRGDELFVDNLMFCAGLKKGGKDACTGDSGGPYICRNKDGKYGLVGIVSFGVGCARSAYPGVYTNVVHYLPWVSAKISANGGGNLLA